MSRSQQDADFRMLMRYLVPGLGMIISIMVVLVAVVKYPEEAMAAREQFREFKEAVLQNDGYDDPYSWENNVAETAEVWKNLQVYPVQEQDLHLSMMWGLFTTSSDQETEMCVAFKGALMTFEETVPGELNTQIKVRYSHRQTTYEWECKEGDVFLVLPSEYIVDRHLMGEY